MGVEKKVISIRLDEGFIEELKEYAKTENRPLSNFIETTLKEKLSDKRDGDIAVTKGLQKKAGV